MVLPQKKNFLVYKDSKQLFDRLSDSDAGKMFKAMFKYNDCGEHGLDPPLDLLFVQFESQFDRDNEKYSNISEKRRKAMQKRWNNR